MTISELNSFLEKAMDDFSSGIRTNYDEGSANPVTEHDINELARQTFYTLDEFRKKIVQYLEEL